MRWCCDQSKDGDEEAYMETADINCKHKTSNGISKLDIFEWSIELRENDLTMDEQNVMKKEIIVGRQLEEILSIKKAKDDLNIREIEIEEEFQTLKEKRQDILTNKPNESIFFSFDCGENIGISYRFYEKTQGEEKLRKRKEQNMNTNTSIPLLVDCEMGLNEKARTKLGNIFNLRHSNRSDQKNCRDCS